MTSNDITTIRQEVINDKTRKRQHERGPDQDQQTRTALHVKAYISKINESLGNPSVSKLLNQLIRIVTEYATPTLCDLLAIRCTHRFILVDPAPLTSAYGDLSAKWIVLSSNHTSETASKKTDGYYGQQHGYDCDFGFVGSPDNNHRDEFQTEFDDQSDIMGDVLQLSDCKLSDCKLLAVRPAEEDSQYLFVHLPSRQLTLIGSNLGVEPIGTIDQSAASLLDTLIKHGAIDVYDDNDDNLRFH